MLSTFLSLHFSADWGESPRPFLKLFNEAYLSGLDMFTVDIDAFDNSPKESTGEAESKILIIAFVLVK